MTELFDLQYDAFQMIVTTFAFFLTILVMFFGFPQKLLAYQWLEDSLTKGEKASEDLYVLSLQSRGGSLSPKADNGSHPNSSEITPKKGRSSAEDAKNASPRHMIDAKDLAVVDSRDTKSASSLATRSSSPEVASPEVIDSHNKPVKSGIKLPLLNMFF